MLMYLLKKVKMLINSALMTVYIQRCLSECSEVQVQMVKYKYPVEAADVLAFFQLEEERPDLELAAADRMSSEGISWIIITHQLMYRGQSRR